MSIRKAKKNWKKFLEMIDTIVNNYGYSEVTIDYEQNKIFFKKN